MEKNKAELIIANAAQILTCAPGSPDHIGLLENSWLAVEGEKILAVGTKEQVMARVDNSLAAVIDASGKVVLPGFVDCHTHLVFGGSRVKEYAAKLTVNDPQVLVERGIKTGIMVSVEMTREAADAQLFYAAAARLKRMLQAGTTTVESKSGYGLNTTTEIKMLKINEQLNNTMPVDVVSTFLGAHGWSPEMSKQKYMELLLKEMIPWVGELGLAQYCDVWCDDGYYTAEESEMILTKALEAGMKPKIHTDAYSYIRGSDLAASMKMVSADHLNYTPRHVMARLAKAGVPGVLLPALDFAVKHPCPFDLQALLQEGMTVALATNLCPGCWVESLQYVMALACRLYGMSPEEAIKAATLGGAQALQLQDSRGSLETGKLADIQIWDVPTYEHVIYRLGGNVVEKVIKKGKLVVDFQSQRESSI